MLFIHSVILTKKESRGGQKPSFWDSASDARELVAWDHILVLKKYLKKLQAFLGSPRLLYTMLQVAVH